MRVFCPNGYKETGIPGKSSCFPARTGDRQKTERELDTPELRQLCCLWQWQLFIFNYLFQDKIVPSSVQLCVTWLLKSPTNIGRLKKAKKNNVNTHGKIIRILSACMWLVRLHHWLFLRDIFCSPHWNQAAILLFFPLQSRCRQGKKEREETQVWPVGIRRTTLSFLTTAHSY